MALPQGIDFRSTAGYVTDPADHTYEILSTGVGNYPRTTPQGNNVGWEAGSDASGYTRNRNSGVDARLAGRSAPTSGWKYRIDLPSAGTYTVRFAAGDASYTATTTWTLKDTTTTLTTLTTGSTSAGGKFKDALDVEYSSAAWPAGNSAYSGVFATTILRVESTSSGSTIAHVYVAAAGGGAVFIAKSLKPLMQSLGGMY